MARPVVGDLAEELYAKLEPYAFEDEAQGWPLLAYVGALCDPLEEIAAYVRDTPDGPGWSVLLDIDRAPSKGLGWLAQFVGVRLRPALSDADQREQVKSTDGFKRGTVGAILAAARPLLTGGKTIELRERYTSDPRVRREDVSYHVGVRTYADETPDPEAVVAALIAAKPARLVLHYELMSGFTFAHPPVTVPPAPMPPADFDDLKAAFAAFDDFKT